MNSETKKLFISFVKIYFVIFLTFFLLFYISMNDDISLSKIIYNSLTISFIISIIPIGISYFNIKSEYFYKKCSDIEIKIKKFSKSKDNLEKILEEDIENLRNKSILNGMDLRVREIRIKLISLIENIKKC